VTAVEIAFVRRLQRRAHGMASELARRELAAYELIRGTLSDAELVRAIQSGHVERLIIELLSDERLDPSLVRLRVRLDQMLLDSARAEATHALPSFIRPIAFNVLNPHVVEAATRLSTNVVDGLKADIRETVRQHAIAGLEAGVNPRTVARGLRDVIGLAPNQEKAVRNFRRLLEAGDAEAFTRELRDRRFDRTMQKAFAGPGLSREQVDQMAEVYRRRMIAFNAETHARTLALDSQRLAQRLSWQDAIDRGVVSADRLVRTWITVGDDRVRPEHVAMNGRQAGFNQPFPNGELEPGESTYNCRCQARVTLATSARRVAA
jgi:hypothetical protein